MFTHDAQATLTWVADFVNTLGNAPQQPPGTDTLTTVEDLDALLAGEPWTGRFDHDVAELEAVRALRPRLRRYWECDEAQVAEIVNTTLQAAKAVPQLADHDGLGWHVHATPMDAPLATRMEVEMAVAMIDVLRAEGLDRLVICAGEDCTAVVVDLTKNRSRIYCDGGCAARAHTAAYRARKASRP